MLYEAVFSDEMYHREATDFVFDVPCKAKAKNDPVSIKDLHNLTRPDNTDNQAPLRYDSHRVQLVGPGIRFDGTRCGQDVIRSRKRLRQSLAVFRRALRKPRLVKVGEGKRGWGCGRIRTKSQNRTVRRTAGVVDPRGQKSRNLANRIGVGQVWLNSKHAPSPEVNCTYLVLRYGDPSKLRPTETYV